MSALEENERQTNAVSDSNFRDPSMGIVQQQGCYVVSASINTAVQGIRCKRCVHWNIEQQLKSALTEIFFSSENLERHVAKDAPKHTRWS